MTRSENDLRDALLELERRADEHGALTTDRIVSQVGRVERHHAKHGLASRRAPRWLPPFAAAVAVAAAAVVAVTIGDTSHGPARKGSVPVGAGSPSAPSAVSATTPSVTSAPTPSTSEPPPTSSPITPAAVLEAAAAQLDTRTWKAPGPQDFYYVHSTEVTSWTSVSGRMAGKGRNAEGVPGFIPGCDDGKIVSSGQSGDCSLDDVPHYLADAPTSPAAWDAYLEKLAPGAKAANAQGKIIVQVLHEDLTAPTAAAALLRYTATCPGLHTVAVRPVDEGTHLTGVTCTSMTNGSYGLVFDATSNAFVGFVVLTSGGAQDGPAEIVRTTGIVAAIGDKP